MSEAGTPQSSRRAVDAKTARDAGEFLRAVLERGDDPIRALDETRYVFAFGGADTETSDSVNHPKHYTEHPSGVECITITEHMGFNLGNAIKYVWRADLKGDAVEDLRKARWYIEREIARRGGAS